MLVRLTKKFADALDGIDLSQWHVGEIVAVSRHEAALLIAEGWAEPDHEGAADVGLSNDPLEAQRTPRSTDALRRIRADMDEQSHAEQERRRLEDRIREELHDARAKTIPEEPPRKNDIPER